MDKMPPALPAYQEPAISDHIHDNRQAMEGEEPWKLNIEHIHRNYRALKKSLLIKRENINDKNIINNNSRFLIQAGTPCQINFYFR